MWAPVIKLFITESNCQLLMKLNEWLNGNIQEIQADIINKQIQAFQHNIEFKRQLCMPESLEDHFQMNFQVITKIQVKKHSVQKRGKEKREEQLRIREGVKKLDFIREMPPNI